MKYLFELGKNPTLSRAEIEHVFLRDNIDYTISGHINAYIIVETATNLDTTQLMTELGGTIKIGKELPATGQSPEKSLATYLQETQVGKITFSLSGKDAKKIALATKKLLKHEGRSVRYVEIKNTATILHNNLVQKKSDCVIASDLLFSTQAIQPIEDLGKRDFDRPGRDSKSGMLPPKLAKILINLTATKKDSRILDPFCGSGTIITEGMISGYTDIQATDIAEKAISDTKTNTTWIQKEYPHIQGHLTLCKKVDVKNLSQHIPEQSIDAIVTEPYMGRPLFGNETLKFLSEQNQYLADIYANAFLSFKKILKPDGVVVFVIPQFNTPNGWVYIHCLDQIKKAGFIPTPLCKKSESILYHRPDQHVGRRIWRFTLAK